MEETGLESQKGRKPELLLLRALFVICMALTDPAGQVDLEAELKDLTNLRRWSIFLFAIFAICVPLLGYLFFLDETGMNNDVRSWEDGFGFAIKASTGADVSQIHPVTIGGKIIALTLAVMNLAFFGFLASIIVLSVEIRAKSRRRVRLLGGSH